MSFGIRPMSTRTKIVSAVSAAAVVAATLVLSPGTGNATAPTPNPTEVAVVPAGVLASPPADAIISAGATGYLHMKDGGTDFLWTRYSDQSTTVVTALAGANPSTNIVKPAGGDFVAWFKTTTSPLTETIVDLADQTSQVLTLPVGAAPYAVLGHTVLAHISVGGVQSLELIKYATDGSTTITPVTGFPAATTGYSQVVPSLSNDDTSTVVQFSAGGVASDALVDLTTGVATPIPGARFGRFALSPKYVVGLLATSTTVVNVFSRQGLLDGTDTTPITVVLPSNPRFTVVGEHIIATAYSSSLYVSPTTDIPLDGSDPHVLYPWTQFNGTGIAGGPGGTGLVIGGSGTSDWAAHRLSAGPSNTLVDDASLKIVDPWSNAGVSLNFGQLSHVESGLTPNGKTAYESFNHALQINPGETLTEGVGGFVTGANVCQTGVNCLRVVPGNYYGPLYLVNGNQIATAVLGGVTATDGLIWPWGPAGGVITDASSYFAIVNGTSPATQYVISLGNNTVLSSGPIGAAALWYSTLWKPGATAGAVVGNDLNDPSKPARTVQTGTSCTPSELQADNDWLYWSCGASGPAGAHNLVTGANVSLPAGVAQLGDGFVVTHAAGSGALKLYDFHSGEVAGPVAIGTVPTGAVTDDRLITWSVDKNGGDIAFVDANDAVHVIDPDVPGTNATVEFNNDSTYMYPRAANGQWRPSMWINRPVDSWTMTITSYGGATVATLTGGATREYVMPLWDGTTTGGAMVPSGVYTWTLTATTADGTHVAGTGPIRVQCGTYLFRSYDCDGSSALLGVKSTGEAHWYDGDRTPSGGLRDNDYTDDWSWGTNPGQVSAIIPWGDYNGDGMGDLIVRGSNGVTKAYLGIGQSYFNPDGGIKSVSLGSGWNMYSQMFTTGDVNGDGIFDMLARDSAGGLYMYAGKPGGGILPRVKLSSGWSMYPQVIGVGDITGDGISDLVGIDASGVMWRYNGNGQNSFLSRVRLSAGWGSYTSLLAIGDLNHDGHNDLVARDKAGLLWFYDGDGAGSFLVRTQIGSGWNIYTHLF